MSDFNKDLQEEKEYLDRTKRLIQAEITRLFGLLSGRKEALRNAGKEMWENSAHYTDDFEKLTEVVQHLNEVSNQSKSYSNTIKQLERYRRMQKEPYFGRFDFTEDGAEDKEKIYVGLHSAMDSKTREIAVYDWRAPISSVFYRYELGRAEYTAPYGSITGEVQLKRQYKLKDSELNYFFDCSVKIDDEILQEVLSHNTSTKMKNIVETIQREQDTIIRDTENELLIVQGVAGSGKTSVALHRIAYLLYHGLNTNINSQDIIIVSPNAMFSKYISEVLPELGEENVNQMTFEDFAHEILKDKGRVERRGEQLEYLISLEKSQGECIKTKSIEFKGSKTFVELLNRYIAYYECRMIGFEDIYYAGRIIESKHLLKSSFLDNKINMPMAKRLKRIENIIMDRTKPLQKERVTKIEKLVQRLDGHEFDIKPFSRLLSIKEIKALLKRMRRFTEIDYYEAYYSLFAKEGLLQNLAVGLELPMEIGEIIERTRGNLGRHFITYEDASALAYLKLKLEGNDQFSGIRHVVIDEAQDYSPLQYEVFNILFKGAGYTVLGDINQSIEKEGYISIYDTILKSFDKKRWLKIVLNRSYRSSLEITAFAQKLLNEKQDIIPFERHEEEPVIVQMNSMEEVSDRILKDIKEYLSEGYESVAIICKTAEEAEKLYSTVRNSIDIKLITSSEDEIKKGVSIIPGYMSKGLEFDAVLVFDVSCENYSTELDRRLLYIACTRALHRLVLYHVGEKSLLIK